MWHQPDDTHIPVRNARARFSELTNGNQIVAVLNHHQITALIIPAREAFGYNSTTRDKARREIRRQLRQWFLQP